MREMDFNASRSSSLFLRYLSNHEDTVLGGRSSITDMKYTPESRPGFGGRRQQWMPVRNHRFLVCLYNYDVGNMLRGARTRQLLFRYPSV